MAASKPCRLDCKIVMMKLIIKVNSVNNEFKVRENLGFRARGRKVNDAGNASLNLEKNSQLMAMIL